MPAGEFGGIAGISLKGFVEDGVNVQVSYTSDLHQNFAIGATIGHSSNNLDTAAIAAASAISVDTEPWKSTYVLADVYAKLPVQSWALYAKGSAGVMLPRSWNLYAENEDGSGSIHVSKKFIPAYQVAAGIKYTIQERVDVGVESGMLASKPEFKIDLEGFQDSRKQWIIAWNSILKVGYRF
jgi:hypothetical protein